MTVNIEKMRDGLRWPDWKFFAGMVAVLLAAFGFGLAISTPPSYRAEERALCDRAVSALVSSPDLVEVTRAGIIVRQLRCGIGRRLPVLAK